MEITCIIGKSDMKDFTSWWESHLPSWIIVYCSKGEAILTLQFKSYTFKQGTMSIIPPDMFPAFISMTEDFMAFYCLLGRNFAETIFYDTPKEFFNAIYAEPVLTAGSEIYPWIKLLNITYSDETNPYRHNIIAGLLHAFTLDYYRKWELQYGSEQFKDEKTSAEAICTKFYNLIFDHFKEQRNTAFYADKLCITPCYLAMITRQLCHETPKQAIDRQVTLEMKYILRNTTMSTKQLANHLHFPDTSYMCRFFRRQTGLSLSEYRKRNDDAT